MEVASPLQALRADVSSHLSVQEKAVVLSEELLKFHTEVEKTSNCHGQCCLFHKDDNLAHDRMLPRVVFFMARRSSAETTCCKVACKV